MPKEYSPGQLVYDHAYANRFHYNLFTWYDTVHGQTLTWLYGIPYQVEQNTQHRQYIFIGSLFAGSLLATLFVGLLFGRRMGVPLLHMMEWLQSIAAGRWVEPTGEDGQPRSVSSWAVSVIKGGLNMLVKVWFTEVRKLARSAVWIPVALTPLLTLLIGLLTIDKHSSLTRPSVMWEILYFGIAPLYALLLLPLAACAIAALVCRIEHLSGSWELLHAFPTARAVPDTTTYGILLAGFVFLYLSGSVPWAWFAKGMIGGWLAVDPLAALQFWVACAWESFGAQFAISTILTIPAIAVFHSKTYGPLYPWAQPMLAMVPHQYGLLFVSFETSAISGIIIIVGSAWYFLRCSTCSFLGPFSNPNLQVR